MPLTAIMGVCTVALLTGIVGAGFSKQMSKQYAEFEHKLPEALEDGIISGEGSRRNRRAQGAYGFIKTQADELVHHLIESKRSGMTLRTGQGALASNLIAESEHHRHQAEFRLCGRVFLLHLSPAAGTDAPSQMIIKARFRLQ